MYSTPETSAIPMNPMKTTRDYLDAIIMLKPVYKVSQMGYFEKFLPTFISADGNKYGGLSIRGSGIPDIIEGHFGDVNIGSHHNVHFLFADEGNARKYSDDLRSDENYIESVRQYHIDLDELFDIYPFEDY